MMQFAAHVFSQLLMWNISVKRIKITTRCQEELKNYYEISLNTTFNDWDTNLKFPTSSDIDIWGNRCILCTVMQCLSVFKNVFLVHDVLFSVKPKKEWIIHLSIRWAHNSQEVRLFKSVHNYALIVLLLELV